MKKFLIYIVFVLLIISCGENTSVDKNLNDNDGSQNASDEITDKVDDESFDESVDEIADENSDQTVDETVDEIADETVDDSAEAIYELLEASEAKDLIDERKDDPFFHIIDVRTTANLMEDTSLAQRNSMSMMPVLKVISASSR